MIFINEPKLIKKSLSDYDWIGLKDLILSFGLDEKNFGEASDGYYYIFIYNFTDEMSKNFHEHIIKLDGEYSYSRSAYWFKIMKEFSFRVNVSMDYTVPAESSAEAFYIVSEIFKKDHNFSVIEDEVLTCDEFSDGEYRLVFSINPTVTIKDDLIFTEDKAKEFAIDLMLEEHDIKIKKEDLIRFSL